MILGLPLEVNDSLQVRIRDADSSSLCESRVEEMAADELLISWPTDGEDRIAVHEHQVLVIWFRRDHTVYEFEATVLDMLEDPIALLAVRPSGPLRSIQRRDNVRVPARTPIELTARVVGIEPFKSGGSSHHHIQTETVNISAGGFTIHHHSPLEIGALFAVRVVLPGESRQPLAMNAQVVRCKEMENHSGSAPIYELGFSYTRISESARARIVRFVFGAQREEHLEE